VRPGAPNSTCRRPTMAAGAVKLVHARAVRAQQS